MSYPSKPVIVVNPLDADKPLPIAGDFTIEYSKQIAPGTFGLMSEEAIQDGIRQVLEMR